MSGLYRQVYPVAVYPENPGPETAHLTLPQLLAGIEVFCPSCGLRVPDLSDFNTQGFTRMRLSATEGSLSPQALGGYFITHGLINAEQLTNVLRSNLMEDLLPTPAPFAGQVIAAASSGPILLPNPLEAITYSVTPAQIKIGLQNLKNSYQSILWETAPRGLK